MHRCISLNKSKNNVKGYRREFIEEDFTVHVLFSKNASSKKLCFPGAVYQEELVMVG